MISVFPLVYFYFFRHKIRELILFDVEIHAMIPPIGDSELTPYTKIMSVYFHPSLVRDLAED